MASKLRFSAVTKSRLATLSLSQCSKMPSDRDTHSDSNIQTVFVGTMFGCLSFDSSISDRIPIDTEQQYFFCIVFFALLEQFLQQKFG